MSVVLDTVLNENYEPSETELIEYGKWLGMDLPTDKPFLWIAREGLKAPLPENWKACKSEKGELYYFNFKSGESNWDHPMDEHFRELLKNEKESPGPKSIANGAKRKLNPIQTVVEVSKEKEVIIDKSRSPLSGNSKMHTLKSLKLKKELPEDLRIELKPGNNSSSDTSERSPIVLNLKEKSNLNGYPVLKQITESSSFEREGETINSEKENFTSDLDDQLKRFQSEKLKEHQIAKEEYEKKLKESWSRHKKRLEEDYENKSKILKNDLEKKINLEEKKLEENYTISIQQLTDKLNAGYELEANRIRQYLNERQEKEKSDLEQEFQIEIRNIKKNKIEELEKLRVSKNENIEAIRYSTKDLEEDTLNFLDTYKKAQDSFNNILLDNYKKIPKNIEMILNQLINSAKESYEIEIENINKSYYTEIDQIKRKFAVEIYLLEKEHKEFIQQNEKQKKDIEDILKEKSKLLSERETKSSFTRSTQCEIKDYQNINNILDIVPKYPNFLSEIEENSNQCENDTIGIKSEKDVFQSVVALMKESQKKEIEEVKKDLRRYAEEELKTAMDEILQERRHILIGNSIDEKDEMISLQGLVKAPLEFKRESSEFERPITLSPDAIRRDDLTAVITEALRTVFSGSPFIIPSPTSGETNIGGIRQRCNSETIPSSSTIETKMVKTKENMEGFPVSFQEQKLLLSGERQRVVEGKKFVENQRLNLEERRVQLKVARHQWKQDVITAKQEGLRSSSRRGQLLNKLRVSLDNQAKGLEHDETILRDSERWLSMKEQMVHQMEQQINELETGKLRDMSINSVDTVALMTGFFKPTRNTTNSYPQVEESTQGITNSRKLGTVYAKTLDKIARRLEEVTSSMMNLQQMKRTSSLLHGNSQYQRLGQKSTKDMDYIRNKNRDF